MDSDKDRQLAAHVCKVHSGYTGAKNDMGDALQLGFKAYDSNFMRAYVRRAKTYEPLLEDSLVQEITDAYVSMRDDEKRADIDARKSYTTPRTLLGIVRLSQANARARFSDRVQRQDFDEAMRLLKAAKESVELAAPAKRGANALDIVYDLLKDLSHRSEDREGWVALSQLIALAGHKALSSE